LEPIPATPIQDATAADASTLERMGRIEPQPTADPEPPAPPVYDELISPA